MINGLKESLALKYLLDNIYPIYMISEIIDLNILSIHQHVTFRLLKHHYSINQSFTQFSRNRFCSKSLLLLKLQRFSRKKLFLHNGFQSSNNKTNPNAVFKPSNYYSTTTTSVSLFDAEPIEDEEEEINIKNENENENQLIYEEYMWEYGRPKTTKYLIAFAKHKGTVITLSEAVKLMDINKNLLVTDIIKKNKYDEIEDKEQEESDIDDDDEEKPKQSEVLKSLNDALLSVLGSDDDDDDDYDDRQVPTISIPESDNNGMGLKMSSTLLSATPDPQTPSIINEDAEMMYNEEKTLNRNNSNGHQNGKKSDMDLLVNLLAELDEEESDHAITPKYNRNISEDEEDDILRRMKKRHSNSSRSNSDKNVRDYKPKMMHMIDNDYISKKRKKRKKKNNRSHSQPAESMKAIMRSVDTTDYMILPKTADNTNYLILPKSAKVTKSGPASPRYSSKKNKKKKNHHRSLSTDARKHKSVKLEEWRTKYGKKRKSSHSFNKIKFQQQKTKRKSVSIMRKTNNKKIHKMDFNLYDIEIKSNRRYRLIDGRIGIAKYKGKTAFGKGHETYIGILVESGKGVHDGTVGGKSYFRCKHGKGDMVHPFEIIEDLGRFNNPITQQTIDDGHYLVQEAQIKLAQYKKKHNIKTKKKQKI